MHALDSIHWDHPRAEAHTSQVARQGVARAHARDSALLWIEQSEPLHTQDEGILTE